MMGVSGRSLKTRRRKRSSAKTQRRDPVYNANNTQSSSRDMEEIHLKRRVLDHHSELLLTWWDESKSHQEGLLISCKCKNSCDPSASPNSSLPSPCAAAPSVSSTESNSILLREKLNIRSSPFISKLTDSACSGVALYNDANSLSQASPTSSTASTSQPRVISIQPQPVSCKMERSLPEMMLQDDNWRSKRPYPCDYCGKPFRTSYEKRRHEMIHTGDRPWKCTECNKAFVDRACLRNHMKKRHLGVKPFKCAFCDITFFNTMNRATHERTHEERQKAAKQERELLQVKQAPVDAPLEDAQDGEQSRQQPLGDDDGSSSRDHRQIVKEELKNTPHESNDAEMADVFNITVIPDQSATLAVADVGKTA